MSAAPDPGPALDRDPLLDPHPDAGVEAGRAVLRAGVHAARQVFGTRLTGAFALGSLAHGGFAPLVSDVDLMLVLTDLDGDPAADVDRLRERVRVAEPGELSGRLSVFWSDPDGIRDGVRPAGRLPEVDRLDLLDSGLLLAGADPRAGARRPAHHDVVAQAAEFALTKFDDGYLARLADPDGLLAGGPRPVTKAALFPIRFLYTLATGLIGRNEEAAVWFAEHREHAELARAAMIWRRSGIAGSGPAAELLHAHLRPVHRMFADEYAEALRRTGRDGLAAELGRWGARV